MIPTACPSYGVATCKHQRDAEARFSYRLASIGGLVALLTVVLGVASCGKSAESTSPSPAVAAQVAAPSPTENELRSSIASLELQLGDDRRQLAKATTETPGLKIWGTDQDRDEDILQIWGKALPLESDDLNAVGILLQEASIVVHNPDKHASLAIGGTYTGKAYFVERKTAKNGFGVEIPIFVYDSSPPQRIMTLRLAMDEGGQRLTDLKHHLDDLLRPDREAFERLVNDAEKSIMDRQNQVHAGLPPGTTQVVSRATFITYLDTLAKALSEWKPAMERLDHEAAALMTPERTSQLPRWITDFPDLAERWKKIEADETRCNHDRDAVLANDLQGAIAYHRAAVAELPVTVSSSTELVKLAVSIRSILAGLTNTTFDSSLIVPCYSVWWQAAQDAYASNPNWRTATDHDVIDFEATIASNDPVGVAHGSYANLVAKLEDDLGARQLANIPEHLAATNPWTATRGVGLSELDRAYHRALILRFDADETGTNAVRMRTVVEGETHAHPDRWNDKLRAVYGDLQRRQLAAWSDSQIAGSPEQRNNATPVLDAAFDGGTLLPIAEVFTNDTELMWLTALNQQSADEAPFPLAINVAEMMKTAGFEPAWTWRYGKILNQISRNRTAADIASIDSLVDKVVAEHPDQSSEVMRHMCLSVQIKQLLEYAGETKLFPHGADGSRLGPIISEYKYREAIEHSGNATLSDEDIEKWRRNCSRFTIDEITALRLILAKSDVAKAVDNWFGMSGFVASLTPGLWDALAKECATISQTDQR